jgi:hypothetical protein
MTQFKLPALAQELLNVAELGEVTVRSLTFSQRTAYDDLYVAAIGDEVRKAVKDNDEEAIRALLEARRVEFASMTPFLLSLCIYKEGKPVFTQEQWEVFGSTADRRAVCNELYSAAFRLSGLDKDLAEKKSESSPE